MLTDEQTSILNNCRAMLLQSANLPVGAWQAQRGAEVCWHHVEPVGNVVPLRRTKGEA